MRIYFPLILAIAAVSLSACTTVTPAERRAADEGRCAGYGFRSKTDAMARCLLDLDLDRRADLRAFRARQDDFGGSPVIIARPVIVRHY